MFKELKIIGIEFEEYLIHPDIEEGFIQIRIIDEKKFKKLFPGYQTIIPVDDFKIMLKYCQKRAKKLERILEIKSEEMVDNDKCPECGEKIYRSEGCQNCHMCGWSLCDL